jgi:glycosyltransferase involved in cell wall biosynthesis
MFKIPFLFHFHGMNREMLVGTYDTRYAARVFISISKFITDEAVRLGVPADRIVDIPNPAPRASSTPAQREAWRRKFGIPEGAVALAHVGRVIRWKGQLEFLQAFSRIAQACPNAVALIVGDDVEGFSTEYPQSLRELVERCGLNDRVIFTGHVSDILGLMSAVEVVVHSSISPEPFGLVITEAMSAGAAVVAARLGAPTEIVTDGVNGLLVDPCNEDEFASALARLVNDPQLRNSIAQAGHRLALEKYSPEAFARQIERVYRQVVAARPG